MIGSLKKLKSNKQEKEKVLTKATEVALRFLTTRSRSEKELVDRLKKKEFSGEIIRQVVAKCYEWKYLDDESFARGRARMLMRSGKAAGPKVKFDLKHLGVDAETIEAVIEEVAAEFPEKDSCLEIMERRFASFRYEKADQKERRRVINYFLRRGFSYSTVADAVKGFGSED